MLSGSIGDPVRFLIPQGCLSSWATSLPPLHRPQGFSTFFSLLKCLHRTLSLMHPRTLPLCPGPCMTQCHGERIEVSRIFWKSDSHPCSLAVASLPGLCSSPEGAPLIPHPQPSCCRSAEGRAVMPALIFQGAILSPRAADLSHGSSGDKTGVGCPCPGTLLVQPQVEVAGERP